MEIIAREEILTRDSLLSLMEVQNKPCVSIYMPTPWVGAESQQNQIRFRNMLRSAGENLLSLGLRQGEADAMLNPGMALLKNAPFWKKQNDGLAAFASAGVFTVYRLPLKFPELTVSSDRFHLKPLLPLFNNGGGRFYVLAVSMKYARFLQGARNSAIELELKNIPRSLAEAVRYDSPDRQMRSQPTRRGTSTVHGHGIWEDMTKESILRYFQQIDRGLQDLLRNERSPLVFAGVDYLFPIFKEANSYPHLVDQPLAGNPDEMRTGELASLAWKAVQPFYERTVQEALALYKQSMGTGLASNNMEEIVPAASDGKVGYLFVAAGRQQWGSIDSATKKMVLLEKPQQGSEDILDAASVQTYLNGGIVYLLGPEKMPDKSPMAAIFRY